MRTPPKHKIETIASFAMLVADTLKTDRHSLNGVSGEQGEGKSCFSDLFSQAVSKELNRKFTYTNNMIYTRKALKEKIDGKEKLRQYSAIHADELISMFFARNWFDAEQIDGIELLNKCRDRHLCVTGNVPVLWHLDSAFLPLIRFWIHINERGVAWVFEKSRNPWAKDKWYCKENEKLFNKNKHPYACKGFLCEIHYPDWTKAEKRTYYAARNKLRVGTEGQREKNRVERYGDLKLQRDELIRFAMHYSKQASKAVIEALQHTKDKRIIGALKQHKEPLQHKQLADIMGVSPTLIGYVTRGER